MTLQDIKEHLKHFSEDIILEVLDISAEELLDRFEDKIIEQFDKLEEELQDEPED